MKKIIEYIQENHDRYIGELTEFLRIPSVSTDPEHNEAVKTAAEFVARQLQEAGMTTVEIFPTEGHPIVYAERLVEEAKPTLLVYGHYDVQPVDPIELWESAPFEPTIPANNQNIEIHPDEKIP